MTSAVTATAASRMTVLTIDTRRTGLQERLRT
jgi:hypothetical protein